MSGERYFSVTTPQSPLLSHHSSVTTPLVLSATILLLGFLYCGPPVTQQMLFVLETVYHRRWDLKCATLCFARLLNKKRLCAVPPPTVPSLPDEHFVACVQSRWLHPCHCIVIHLRRRRERVSGPNLHLVTVHPFGRCGHGRVTSGLVPRCCSSEHVLLLKVLYCLGCMRLCPGTLPMLSTSTKRQMRRQGRRACKR